MEKPKPVMAGTMWCNQSLWFAILISFVFCFLCFEYSSLNGGYYYGDNTVSVRDSESHRFSTNISSDDSISSVPHHNNNPLDGGGVVVKQNELDSCLGRYIYVHQLPERFNGDLLKNCHLLTPGTEKNMCPYLVNSGFGPGIENHETVLLNHSWFLTNQFLLEVIFHNKMKNYKCLTNDSSLASAIYVPFYAGLDIVRYLFGGFNTSVRDSSAVDLVKWLAEKPEWRKMWGMDHFLVVGRISWDFRRLTDNVSDWGSKLRFLPESKNMSMLSIESSTWSNDFAIPYPTSFHPSKESEIFEWQDRLRRQKRQYLFSFAGAPRPNLEGSIRGKIIDHCLASGSLCKFIDCNYGATNCNNPVKVMKILQDSVFCLQPPGDSLTRRSIFDSILAGCIPVFFHPGTAYAQYLWHLPKNYSSYSLYIPVRDVGNWRVEVNETLLGIPEDRVSGLREQVIKLIPNVIYADPSSKLENLEDGFDLAVKGILERIEKIRSLIVEGGDPGAGFADGDDHSYTFAAYDNES